MGSQRKQLAETCDCKALMIQSDWTMTHKVKRLSKFNDPAEKNGSMQHQMQTNSAKKNKKIYINKNASAENWF